MGINLVLFLSQLISFLILFLVLRQWAWPVLIRTLDKRRLTIEEGIHNAVQARRELAEAEQRIQGMMDQARREAQNTLDQATKTGAKVRSEIEQEARDRARQIVDQAQAQTQQMVAQARVELRQEVADLAILAAERVIGKSVDSATNRQLVNEFVAQSSRE